MSLTHEYHELLEMIPNMKTHDKATPRPWKVMNRSGHPHMVFIGNPTYTPDKRLVPEKPVCQMVITIERQRRGADQANAALIVEAVNSFDDLKRLLRRATNDELGDNWKPEAKALLAKLLCI